MVGPELRPIEWGRRYPTGPIGIIVFVVFVIILLVIVFSLSTSITPPSTGSSLNINGLNVQSPDNACGLNGDNAGTITLQPPPGGGIPFISWGLPGPGGSVPCTVRNVSTNTPGFDLFGSFPYTATSFPSVLVVSMIPPSSFNGVLNVTFT